MKPYLYICLWLAGYENRDWDTEENTICAEKTRLWREINWLMEPCKSLVGSVSFQGRTRQVMTCCVGHLFTPVVKIIICKKLLGFTFIFVTWNGIKNKIWTTCRNKTFGLGFELFPPPFTSLIKKEPFLLHILLVSGIIALH